MADVLLTTCRLAPPSGGHPDAALISSLSGTGTVLTAELSAEADGLHWFPAADRFAGAEALLSRTVGARMSTTSSAAIRTTTEFG